MLHGKELSYNNLLDLDSALNLVREFRTPAACVIKHNNPCGAALGETLAEAFQKAYEGDPLSALRRHPRLQPRSRRSDRHADHRAEPLRRMRSSPRAIQDAAFELLTTRPKWGKNVRILKTGPARRSGNAASTSAASMAACLCKSRDAGGDDFANAKVVTKRPPTDAELADLKFAWLVGKHVKSNAIVLAKDGMIVGVGAGQMSRVDSTEIAVKKAGDAGARPVLASDAFFPFRDNVDAAAKAGVTAIVQPGGSVRDEESIAACDEHGIAMIFTGVRHFRH